MKAEGYTWAELVVASGKPRYVYSAVNDTLYVAVIDRRMGNNVRTRWRARLPPSTTQAAPEIRYFRRLKSAQQWVETRVVELALSR